MASNCTDLLQVLQICCKSLNELDNYVLYNNIAVNHPAVVARRNELFSAELITDSDTYKLLKCCCNNLNELQMLITEHGLDNNDPAVRAREQELQVCVQTITELEYIVADSASLNLNVTFKLPSKCIISRRWLHVELYRNYSALYNGKVLTPMM